VLPFSIKLLTNKLVFVGLHYNYIHTSILPETRITSIKHCAPQISSKMATIDEFALKNIGL
jgi:hypothetical protein